MSNELNSLIDRLIQLIQLRQKRERRIYDEAMVPLFKDIECIHSNYMLMFGNTLNKLASNSNSIADSILDFERSRNELAVLRSTVRGCLKALIVDKSLNAYVNFVYTVWKYMYSAKTFTGEYEVNLTAEERALVHDDTEVNDYLDETRSAEKDQNRIFHGYASNRIVFDCISLRLKTAIKSGNTQRCMDEFRRGKIELETNWIVVCEEWQKITLHSKNRDVD